MITVSKANHPSITLLWFHGSHLNYQRSKSTHGQSKRRVPSTRFDVHSTRSPRGDRVHNTLPDCPAIDSSARAAHRLAPPYNPWTTIPVSPTVPLGPSPSLPPYKRTNNSISLKAIHPSTTNKELAFFLASSTKGVPHISSSLVTTLE